MNRRKHGVSFETAMLAFADPFALSERDHVEGHEARWQTVGRMGNRLRLIVAHTVDKDDEDGEVIDVIRIFSARKAGRRERGRYQHESR